MRRVAVSIAALIAAGLTGCTTQQQTAELQPRAVAAPRGIEGSWASSGGTVAYNASFSGGRYVATEASTGAILAEGTYRSLGPSRITLEYTSRVRGTRIAANCNQMAADRLACVSSSGTRSDLVRRG